MSSLRRTDRNKAVDYIKAFAIILVVLGHSIQYGSGSYVKAHMFDNNYIIYFIYSFHMPIFMIVSGYLYFYSINRYNTKQMIINKTKSLIIPIFFWTILSTLLDCILYDQERLLNPFRFGVAWANEFIGQFWFLWAVFVCSMILLLINRVFKDSIIVYALIFAATFLTPDILLFFLFFFMYPFFVIGYMVNKYKLIEKCNGKVKTIGFIISSVLFVIMLVFIKGNYFIYNSGYTLLGRENVFEILYIDIYRLLIGLLGSYVFVFIIAQFAPKVSGIVDRVIVCLGKNTLGIYIVSFFFAAYLLPLITNNFSGINYFVTIVETVMTIVVSLLIIFAIQKFKWTNRIMLGNWKN